MADNSDDGEDDALGLDDLFTNTHYNVSTVKIPLARNGHDKKNCDTVLEVTLESSNSAATDHDLTGQVIWPVSILLAHFVASSRGQELLGVPDKESACVVEVGAGCGLPGMVASYFGCQVVLTDGNDVVLELLRRNAQRQPQCRTEISKDSRPTVAHENTTLNDDKRQAPSSSCTATKLIWGNPHHVRHVWHVLGRPNGQQLVVLGADVVQWPAVVEPLLHTVKALLWHQSHDSTFVLGLVRRALATARLLFQTADQLGFHYRPSAFVPTDFPRCELWELQLQRNGEALEPPRLLQDAEADGTVDLTLGEGFQQTAFLPY